MRGRWGTGCGGKGERGRKLVTPCLEAEEVILDVDTTEIEAEKQDAQWT
jgi:hypothetical protein